MPEPLHRQTAASGGRANEIGIIAQYRWAARLTLGHLRSRTLRRIYLRDTGAGQVDDFQLLTTDNVLHAYQIKWAQKPGFFTLKDWVKSRHGKLSLLRTLADGWRNRRAHFGETTQVFVHLVTPHHASSSSRCGEVPVPEHERNFEAFIRDAWEPLHDGRAADLNDFPGWENVWAELRTESAMGVEDFLEFVRGCVLEFGAEFAPPAACPGHETDVWQADVQKLADKMLGLAADEPEGVEYDRAHLLRLLGWQDEATPLNDHEWHRNDPWHTSLTETLGTLRRALSTLRSGYVALVGAPGSGKSTALTEVLRGHPDAVRYYAFLRDESQPAHPRGEAMNFLHDLVAMLEGRGVDAGGETPHHGTLTELRTRLQRQLRALHERWRETGRTNILLVDGLDHVPEDPRVRDSLLDELPPPTALPEGVLIILGTQTLEILPAELRLYFQSESARRIVITPLSLSLTRAAFDRAGLGEILGSLLSQAVERVAGLPLALAYLIRWLRDCPPETDLARRLADFPECGGDIARYYARLWGGLETRAEQSVRTLLALLARLRVGFDLAAIAPWAGDDALEMFRRHCGHLFRQEDGHWDFFHHSFRVFVRAQSASRDGYFDKETDRHWHQRIADRCAEAHPDTPLHWEELHHRAASGDVIRALELARPKRFREQVSALRPLRDLAADLSTAVGLLRENPDASVFCRLAFAAHERDLRENALMGEQRPLSILLFHTAPRAIALRHLRRGGRLRLGLDDALALVTESLGAGEQQEAKRLFELIEMPDGYARGPSLNVVGQAITSVVEWATVAVRVWPLDRILAAIQGHDFLADKRLHLDGLPQGREWTLPQTQAEALAQLASALATRGDIESSEAAAAHVAWDLLQPGRAGFLKLAVAEGWLARGEKDNASRTATELHGLNFRQPFVQLRFVEVLVRCGVLEEARRAFASVSPVTELKRRSRMDTSDEEIQSIVRHFAASRVLNSTFEAPHLAAEESQFRLAGLAEIARFHAWHWRGKKPRAEQVRRQLENILDLLREPAEEPLMWDVTFNHAVATTQLAEPLVAACALHGADAMDELCRALTAEWALPEADRQWSLWCRQDLVRRCVRVGASRTWAQRCLTQWEQEIPGPDNAEGRVAIILHQAEAWRSIGQLPQARATLQNALQASFGFGYNDGWRLPRWMDLLAPDWRRAPAWGLENIARVARCLSGLPGAFSSHGGAHSASSHLTGLAFQVSPSAGPQLWRYFRPDRHERADFILEIVRACAELPHAPFDLLLSLLVARIDAEDDPADESHFLAWFCGAHKALGWKRVVALSRKLPSPRPQRRRGFLSEPWWRGLVLGALQCGHNPREFGFTETHLKECRPTWSDGHRVTDESVALVVLESSDLIGALREVRDTARAGRARSHSAPLIGWDSVVSLLLPRLDAAQIGAVTAELADEHHFAYIAAAAALRLATLGALSQAWSLGESALEHIRARRRPDLPSLHDLMAAYTPLLHADAVRARPMLYAACAEHRAPDPSLPDPEDLAPILHLLLTPPEREDFARSAQEFLLQALDGCDRNTPPLNLSLSPMDSQSLGSALEQVARLH